MSVCSKWSREYGCRCCEDRAACDDLGIDPLENATEEDNQKYPTLVYG